LSHRLKSQYCVPTYNSYHTIFR